LTGRFGLKEMTIKKIQTVLAQYPVVDMAILYGSRARGNYKQGSDIDLTLLGEEKLMLQVLGRIITDLDDLLLPYMIDLSIFSQITDPDVINHIRRAGVTFYQKETSVGDRA